MPTDRRILNEEGLLVFPDREPTDFSKFRNLAKPYNCSYHNPPAAQELREIIKNHNRLT